MKCLPREKIPLVRGRVLHDWHAEVLAIRAFNRFLIDECAELAKKGLQSETAWLKWRHLSSHQHAHDISDAAKQPFDFQDNVTIHMYCSAAPCGDASMELSMRDQPDSTPWPSSPPPAASPSLPNGPDLLGRSHFSLLGIVRRKPSRPDAPPTWSKSCSDKLALKQCTSLLSSLTTRLVHPGKAYLSALVLPEKQFVAEACERAFGAGGRMAGAMATEVRERWERDGYGFRGFEVRTTRREFEYGKGAGGAVAVPSNLSAVYTTGRQETLINGALEGRRWDDSRAKVSCVSRRALWRAVVDVVEELGWPAGGCGLRNGSYGDMKESESLEGRRKVKDDVRRLALKGWKRNLGDEEWELE